MNDVGMDTGQLSAIDDFVAENYLATKRYPGFSFLVSRNGEIAHRSDQGYADDAIFRIYSMHSVNLAPLNSLYACCGAEGG